MTAHNLAKNLLKKGNALVGSGCYAAVFNSTNTDRVIKLGATSSDPWLDYYRLVATKYKGNPAVPLIYSLHIDYEHDYYVCVMEKLSSNKLPEAFSDSCRDFTTTLITEQEFIDSVQEYNLGADYVTSLLKVLRAIQEYTDVLTYYEQEDTYDDLYRRLDLHSGNIMYRDGVPVITDPWCEVFMEDVRDFSESAIFKWCH